MAKTPSPQPLSLIGRGANVPVLRFPEFTTPWRIEKLEDVSKIERGKFTPRPRNDPKYYGGDIPFVQTSDVTFSCGRVTRFSQTLNNEGLKVSKLFPKGTILITIAANIGYTGILDVDMACPDSLIGISCSENMHNAFLNFYLHTQQPKLDYLAPEAAQRNINIEFLAPYPVPITSLKEQQKIADFLTAVDTKIQQLKRKHSLMQQYKKGVMQQLFSQQVRFKDDDGSDYPDWEDKWLGELLSESQLVGSSGDIAKKLTVKLWGRGVFEKNEVRKGSENTRYYKRKAGQLIYSKLDFLNCAFGIIPEKLDGYESTVDLPCFDIERNVVPSLLLERIMMRSFYEKLGSRADGTRKAKRIHVEVFLSFPIMMPCLEEQGKIADFLGAIDTKIQQLDAQITQAETFKKGLLQQMFV